MKDKIEKKSEKEVMTLLQAVDAITKNAKGSTLDKEFVLKMKDAEDAISIKLGTTDTQSMLMALFISHAFDDTMTINTLFDGTECPASRKLELLNDVDWLIENHYLGKRSDRWGQSSFRLSSDVVKAFQHNCAYMPKGYEKVSARTLFYVLEDLFEAREDNNMSYENLTKEVSLLFDANPEQEFVRKVHSLGLNMDDEMLLIVFFHLFVNNNDDNIGWHDLRFLYDRKSLQHCAQSGLSDGTHVLFNAGIIENTNSEGFIDREEYKLTEKAKRDFLGELHLKSVTGGKVQSDVIKAKDIKKKSLYFPQSVDRQVGELTDILQERNYRKVCQRMKKKGFHNGFTCLFYGTPGTGKTETVYQIAKETGRDVMLVDIPQIRSMWVGESEKNVKGIFVRYRSLVHDSRRTPILLFNEADAIIGKRTHNHDSAADKMENTMQNIILQEMENLNGILIATTNLQGNMDKAFERRFLYKIMFDRPDAESRRKIWHYMIPELDEAVITKLSQNYDFSGGQIENIARRYNIGCILKGDEAVSLQTLMHYCDDETIKNDKHKIGF